jgi:hypothetical protein
VQKSPGDAAAALHPQVIIIAGHLTRNNQTAFARRQRSTLPAVWSATIFRNSGKPRIALTNKLREDHCTPESFRIEFRMKCVGKTCCACNLAACRKSFPDFRILELAKGFEPLTP